MGVRQADAQSNNNNVMCVRVRVFATRSDNEVISAAAGQLLNLNKINSAYRRRRPVAESKTIAGGCGRFQELRASRLRQTLEERAIEDAVPAPNVTPRRTSSAIMATNNPLPDIIPVPPEVVFGVQMRQIADEFDDRRRVLQAQRAAAQQWAGPHGNIHVWVIRVFNLVGELLLPLRMQLL